jgi:hypothetical protein
MVWYFYGVSIFGFRFIFVTSVCLYVYVLSFQVIVWEPMINSSLVLLTTITMAANLIRVVRQKSITGACGGFLQVVDTVIWMENTNEEGMACPQGMDWSGTVGKVLDTLWKAPRWWYAGLDMKHYLLVFFLCDGLYIGNIYMKISNRNNIYCFLVRIIQMLCLAWSIVLLDHEVMLIYLSNIIYIFTLIINYV